MRKNKFEKIWEKDCKEESKELGRFFTEPTEMEKLIAKRYFMRGIIEGLDIVERESK